MAYGWEGELVRLVPLDWDRHFENYVRWLNDPDVTAFLMVGDFPLTRVAQKEWFDARSADSSGTDIIFAVETLDGEHLGSSGLHNINFRNGTATSGTLLGEPTKWGKGYGTDAARIRARYCFEVLNLRVILSSYLEGNTGSAIMQERTGYEVVGRLPKVHWKRGCYRDEILTCLTRERWETLMPPTVNLV